MKAHLNSESSALNISQRLKMVQIILVLAMVCNNVSCKLEFLLKEGEFYVKSVILMHLRWIL